MVLEFWFAHSKCHFFWSENGHFCQKCQSLSNCTTQKSKIAGRYRHKPYKTYIFLVPYCDADKSLPETTKISKKLQVTHSTDYSTSPILPHLGSHRLGLLHTLPLCIYIYLKINLCAFWQWFQENIHQISRKRCKYIVLECWLPLFKKLNFHLLSLRQVSTRPYCAQKGFLDKLNGQLPGRVENATKGRGLLLFYRKEWNEFKEV